MARIQKITTVNKCVPLSFPFDKEVNSNKKRWAIFDWDETLVHCQVKNMNSSQYIIDVPLPSRKTGKIGVNVRPNWNLWFEEIKEKYVVVIYTASHQSYADAVLNFMDPDGIYFPYRWYRNNCTSVKYEGKEIYIKDWTVFKNIHLKDMIIIDNSAVSFTYHIDNGWPIWPYYDSECENELKFLSCYLNFIYDFDDWRKANKTLVKWDHYRKWVK